MNSDGTHGPRRAAWIALALCVLGLVGCSAGILGLRRVDEAAPTVRNGSLMFARVQVDVIGGPAYQALPLSVSFMPDVRRNMDVLLPSGKETSASGFWVDLPKGLTYLVISPAAGDFHWHGMRAENGLYTTFDWKSKFTIKPGALNYVGDIRLEVDYETRKSRFVVVDRYDEAMRGLQERYPATFALLPARNGVQPSTP